MHTLFNFTSSALGVRRGVRPWLAPDPLFAGLALALAADQEGAPVAALNVCVTVCSSRARDPAGCDQAGVCRAFTET